MICNVLHLIYQAISCKFEAKSSFFGRKLKNTIEYFDVFRNPRVPCQSMPQIDLSAWRENVVQGCQIGGRHVAIGQSAFPSPCTSCICTNEGVS